MKNIIFSSSCTVYGATNEVTIKEEQQKAPINPYANSKFFVEKILEDFAHAYQLKYAILRYFNAAGIDIESGLKRSPDSQHFLIPRALLALLDDSKTLPIFGTDYPTPDGTAIRDYIHVKDLADAHTLALTHLLNTQSNIAVNLGTGSGCSVLDILSAIKQVTKRDVPTQIFPRREGDVPQAVADPSLVKRVLNFTPRYSDLHTIIDSEWRAIHEDSLEVER